MNKRTLLQELWTNLKESPLHSETEYIPEIFKNDIANQRTFNEYKNKNGKSLKIYNRIPLVSLMEFDYTNGLKVIYCMNFGTNRIEFECKYKPNESHNIVGNYSEIYGISRDMHITDVPPYLKGIADDLYFNYLFPIHGTLVSDFSHTNYGIKVWKRIFKHAFDNNLHAYAIFLGDTNNSLFGVNDAIQFENFAEFLPTFNLLWTKHEDSADFRLIISKEPSLLRPYKGLDNDKS